METCNISSIRHCDFVFLFGGFLGVFVKLMFLFASHGQRKTLFFSVGQRKVAWVVQVLETGGHHVVEKRFAGGAGGAAAAGARREVVGARRVRAILLPAEADSRVWTPDVDEGGGEATW
jgi:hypothetical protein